MTESLKDNMEAKRRRAMVEGVSSQAHFLQLLQPLCGSSECHIPRESMRVVGVSGNHDWGLCPLTKWILRKSTCLYYFLGIWHFCTSCMLSYHQSDECVQHPHKSVPVVRMGHVTLSKTFSSDCVPERSEAIPTFLCSRVVCAQG